MKSNKGITIISLLVYIIVLSIVIGTISILMKYFYRNEKESAIAENSSGQYSRLISYITDDVNSEKITNVDIVNSNSNTEPEEDPELNSSETSGEDINLTFNDSTVHEYKFSENKIYNIVKNINGTTVKKIEICSDVTNALFKYDSEAKKITLYIKINNKVYTDVFIVK